MLDSAHGQRILATAFCILIFIIIKQQFEQLFSLRPVLFMLFSYRAGRIYFSSSRLHIVSLPVYVLCHRMDMRKVFPTGTHSE